MLMAAIMLLPLAVKADTAVVTPSVLPSGRHGTSAAWDGKDAYIFGGHAAGGSLLSQIIRYNTTTGVVTTMGATLPGGKHYTSAAAGNSAIYIFGGLDSGLAAVDSITRYEPATDTATVIEARLPSPRDQTSAIWDGSMFYVFGGRNATAQNLDDIVRFDPLTKTVTALSVALPSARQATSAVWDGQNAYVFGGTRDGLGPTDDVIRFNPIIGSTTLLSTKLPVRMAFNSAVWDGSNAILFGGDSYYPAPSIVDTIIKFNTTSEATTTATVGLPSARDDTSAIWDGANAYIFGGSGQTYLTEIVRYSQCTIERQNHLFVGMLGIAVTDVSASWEDNIPRGCAGNPFTLTTGDPDSDFDVCWYAGSTQLSPCYETAGNETGTIPAGSTSARIAYYFGTGASYRLEAN